MARFPVRFLTGFIGAILLSALVFARAAGRNHVLLNVLTLEKFPTFGLQVLSACLVAGVAWALIDAWTHPSPASQKTKSGDGIVWFALSRLILGFGITAYFTTYYLARGTTDRAHRLEAIRAALTPEGFAPIAVPVITVSLIMAIVWMLAGVLSYNSGVAGDARRAV